MRLWNVNKLFIASHPPKKMSNKTYKFPQVPNLGNTAWVKAKRVTHSILFRNITIRGVTFTETVMTTTERHFTLSVVSLRVECT